MHKPSEYPPGDVKYFTEIAKVVATRSKCLKKQVGAIAVRDRHILSTGYNGPPAGFKHCTTCVRLGKETGFDYDGCSAVHAELNCILQAAKFGISLEGATIYCTHPPCDYCARAMVNSGIVKIYSPHALNNYSCIDLEKATSLFTLRRD